MVWEPPALELENMRPVAGSIVGQDLAHRLHSPLLSDEANRRVYGKCNNPFGHGHDYVLDITPSGPLDPATGRLVPLSLLDTLVRDTVLHDVAWRNLNVEVEEFVATSGWTGRSTQKKDEKKVWESLCPVWL